MKQQRRKRVLRKNGQTGKRLRFRPKCGNISNKEQVKEKT
jgi:hypothetical protein